MNASEVLTIVQLSLRVSLVSTLLILIPGVATGWFLARGPARWRAPLQALVSLPMVLPPVAVGLLLLHLFARESLLGRISEGILGNSLLLSWQGASLAAAVMSFPLLVMGARQGFESVPLRLESVAATLGATRLAIFRRVTLPLARRGILYGVALAFARGLGEFGATAIVAGHVPGRTETLALGIYARIQNFEDREALFLAGCSLVLAIGMIALAEFLLRRPAGER